MQFSQSRLFRAVCLLFAFALTVSASPVLNKPATLQCSARNIAIVRRTVLDEAYFCKWWLSDIRTRSPFLEFTPEQVTKLCKCVAATPSKPKREATVPLLEKRQTKASCSAEVSIRFTQPWRFCNFYSAYPRTTSPFPKYSANRLLDLCKCALGKATSSSKTSSSTKPRSTSTLSTSSRKTSTVKTSLSIKKTSSTVKSSSSSSRPVSKSSSSSARPASKSSSSSSRPASKSSTSSSRIVSMSSSSTKSKSSGSTVKPSSTSSTSSKVVALPSKLSSSISIATKPFSSSSKASRSSAQSASKSSSSKAVVSSSSKSSLSLPTITATSSKITSSSKASSSQQTSSSRATSSLQPSVTSSLPFCSVQSSAFGGNIVRLAQASQYCSSLLRSTVSTVATSTKVVTITLPTVQGTATRYINSTVESTVVVAKVETENVIISVTAQSTATQTSDILDYVETTNIGATSVTTVTEVTTSTVTLDTDSSTPVAMVNRDVDVSGVLVPEVWSGLPSTQLRQACNCILDENSVDPTTVYSSKTTQTQTTTEMSSFEAETTATNLVTSLSTSTHTSTLRLNLTSTVSTRVSDYTLTSIRNATYTISSDSFATSTQHIIELTTYSPIRVPTPTASDIPAVALSQPTAIAGNVNGAPNYVDDQVFSLSLPVALTLYGQSSTNVMVSSNAVLGLGSIDASLGYEQMPITRWLGPTVLGLWEDLLIYAGTQQGIYYQVSGSAPSRQTTFEFYIGSFRSQTEYYHFLIKFAEDKPNIVTYQYLEVSDRGATAVVGVLDFFFYFYF
ncbi:hypothetical protein D6D06_09994 [Aureobasidium pullulans]|nr:hypothetical protein D6D06_09994 [Aureobasidium pullulans]